jgi:hypothetical protein
LIQGRRGAHGPGTLRELLTAQKIVDGEPAHVATLDERLAAAAD